MCGRVGSRLRLTGNGCGEASSPNSEQPSEQGCESSTPLQAKSRAGPGAWRQSDTRAVGAPPPPPPPRGLQRIPPSPRGSVAATGLQSGTAQWVLPNQVPMADSPCDPPGVFCPRAWTPPKISPSAPAANAAVISSFFCCNLYPVTSR